MTVHATLRVSMLGDTEWKRHVQATDRQQLGVLAQHLMFCLYRAAHTAHPAWRDMADTMLWEEMR